VEPAGERFRLGRVVARSVAIWGRSLPLVLALVLVVHIPRVAIVEAASQQLSLDPAEPLGSRPFLRFVLISLGQQLLGTLFENLSLAPVIFAVYARLRRRPATFLESVRGSLRRAVPVLRASLGLFLLEILLSMASFALWWRLIHSTLDMTDGLVLAISYGTYVLALAIFSPLWVVVPAAIADEGRQPFRASWRLTRHHRVAVFSLQLLIFGASSGSFLLLGDALSDLPQLLAKVVSWTLNLLSVSLTAVFVAVSYHALKMEKEGVDVSTLEEVFA